MQRASTTTPGHGLTDYIGYIPPPIGLCSQCVSDVFVALLARNKVANLTLTLAHGPLFSSNPGHGLPLTLLDATGNINLLPRKDFGTDTRGTPWLLPENPPPISLPTRTALRHGSLRHYADEIASSRTTRCSYASCRGRFPFLRSAFEDSFVAST